MSNGPENPNTLIDMAAALHEHVGLYYDEIFLATAHVYPTVRIINNTTILMRPKSDLLVGGLDDEGRPVVHLGTKGPLTQAVRDRIVRRMELPVPPLAKYDDLLMRIIFGHELGHVLQADPEFENLFGTIDRRTYIPEDNYLAYLYSDKEMNADYIAACLVSSTDLGQKLAIPAPKFPPLQWRNWAVTHH